MSTEKEIADLWAAIEIIHDALIEIGYETEVDLDAFLPDLKKLLES